MIIVQTLLFPSLINIYVMVSSKPINEGAIMTKAKSHLHHVGFFYTIVVTFLP